MSESAFDHGFGAWLLVAFEKMPLEGAAVDADAHGAAIVARGLDDLAHAAGVADVSRVDADASGACVCSFDGPLIVEVDVGDDGNVGVAGDFTERDGGVLVGAGDSHNVRAGTLDLLDLLESFGCVRGLRVCHGLDADRSVAANSSVADLYGIGFPSPNVPPRTHLRASVKGTGRVRSVLHESFGHVAFPGIVADSQAIIREEI